jgi:hypothetical protein
MPSQKIYKRPHLAHLKAWQADRYTVSALIMPLNSSNRSSEISNHSAGLGMGPLVWITMLQYAALVVDGLLSADPWRPRMIEIRGQAEAIEDGGQRLGSGYGAAFIRIHLARIIRVPGEPASVVGGC